MKIFVKVCKFNAKMLIISDYIELFLCSQVQEDEVLQDESLLKVIF